MILERDLLCCGWSDGGETHLQRGGGRLVFICNDTERG